jgi:hypothetical protein
MARRRKHSELSVSLFPFLSVLSCVIGTLTLMIAASAIGRVAEDLEEEPGPPEIIDEILIDDEDLAALQARIDAAELLQQDLEGVRSQLRAAGFEVDEEADVLDDLRRRAELARLRERTRELEAAKVDLDEALKVVRKETSARVRRARSAPITIQPHGEGTGLVPFFVECAEDGIRVHRPGSDRSVLLRIDDLAEAARFQAALRRVRGTRGGAVIFLIRPDGIDTYNRALKEVEKLTIRHGKLPLPGDGELDFSLF